MRDKTLSIKPVLLIVDDQIIDLKALSIGQALGHELVAEGVETQEQADALLEQGCQIMQGYLYCRPVTFPQIASFLASGLNIHAPQAS